MDSLTEEKLWKILHRKASEAVKQNKIADAVVILDEIVASNPRDFLAFFKLAQIYFASRQYERSEAMCQKAIMCSPNDIRPWLILGNIYIATSNFDRIVSQLPFALTIDPGNFQINYLIGYGMAKNGKFAEAKHYLQTALKAKPSNVQAIQALNIVNQALSRKSVI